MECGSGSKWDSLKLEVPIDSDTGNDGQSIMKALIRYITPFLLIDNLLIITFGLGEDYRYVLFLVYL